MVYFEILNLELVEVAEPDARLLPVLVRAVIALVPDGRPAHVVRL